LSDNGFVVAWHSVRLPMRNGNQIPESAGASLVLVYRDPNEPLRKVVLYDGIDIQQSLSDTMSKTIRGFYQSAASRTSPQRSLTSSGPGQTEQQRTHHLGRARPTPGEYDNLAARIRSRVGLRRSVDGRR
jgi:hypothetical protein